MENPRERLLTLLCEKSFMYSPEPVYRLASGAMSSFYINCKKTTYHPEGIVLAGGAVFDLAKKYSPDAVGGLTLGADPLAVAAAAESWRRGQPMKAFVVRKQTKDHGTKSPIEGDLNKGDRVVILEDVITTGGSALTAVRCAREFGLEVLAVVALVDRQEGGREKIAADGVPVESVFTKEEVFGRHRGPKART